MRLSSRSLSWPAIALAAMIAAACSDDNATPSNPTLDAQFVGYSEPLTRQTTCGNCHIEKQRAWQDTKHAHAWNDLQASGHASSSCYNCHTTSGFSNDAPNAAGFFAVDSAAQQYYYDVQCEACHGPGAAHVAGPETVQPIAPILADTGATTGCGTCHSGAHNPFVEEWRASRHGILNSYPAGRSADACPNCHEGRRATLRFDPAAVFVEQGQSTLQPIVCSVCHDPHGSDNPAQLRFPVDEKDINVNLCMQCHNNRAAPVGNSGRGNQGHGVQGQVFLGVAGWIPPNFTYDTTLIESAHGSTANPRTCAGCHVNSWSWTAGSTTEYSVGHSFNPTPCVDANGIPTSAGFGGCPVGERSFRACAVSGCHPTENSARGSFVSESTLVQSFVNTIWQDLDGDETIDTAGVDQGLLPQIKKLFPGEINSNDATITVADGAEFNVRMLAPDLAGHPDGSKGAHNPFYYEALLIGTVNALRSTYGLPAPPAERTLFEQRMRRLGMVR